MNVIEIIGRKRDGLEYSVEEIRFLLDGFLAGDVRDYQVAAWLMAIVVRGMTQVETLALTQAMVESGEVMEGAGGETDDFGESGPLGVP